MAATRDGLLLAAVLDVRHRHLRLIHGLRQQAKQPDPAMRALIDAAIHLVMVRLRDFEVELQLYVLLEPDPPPKITSDPQVAEAWSRLSRLQSQSLAETQRDLFKYIPMPSTVPADVGFFLARGAGLSATRESHRRRFGLTVTRFSRWESESYGEAPSRVAALPIPYAERLTPLRWTLLLHELGHHILPADDYARRSGQDDTETVIGSALGPVASAQASASTGRSWPTGSRNCIAARRTRSPCSGKRSWRTWCRRPVRAARSSPMIRQPRRARPSTRRSRRRSAHV